MKKLIRKTLTHFMVAVMVVQLCIPMCKQQTVSVEAASELPIINEAIVTARIKELARILEINDGNFNDGWGIQFTANEGPCASRHPTNDSDGCTNCKNSYVVQSEKFKNRFGYNVNSGLLTRHYYPTGTKGSHIGNTCHGFAAFALWYIGKENTSSDVVAELVGTAGAAFTYENLVNFGIRTGDVIRYCDKPGVKNSSGHSMMFLSFVGTNQIKVLDCNAVDHVVDKVATVRIHNITLNPKYTMAISRVTNYIPDSGVADNTMPNISDIKVAQDSSGYTISCTATDNVGIQKVCFPTWTDYNGQDDLASDWQNTQLGSASGNTFTFRVYDHEHNLEHGIYNTHIYAFDTSGNHVMVGFQVDLQNTYTPVNQVIYKNSLYLAYDDLLSWSEAKAKCEEFGGHLATITSQGEQDVISNLINYRDIFRMSYYLGGISGNNYPNWITGEAATYTALASDYATHYNTTELAIDTCYKTWDYYDYVNEPIGFICEIEYPITLDSNTASLTIGTSKTLNLTNTESQLTVSDITWTSSNTSVATVSNGTITAISAGTATITGKYGTKTATCTITVTEPISEVITLGDANGDNTIDIKDAVMLKQHLAGMTVSINLKNSELNADGIIDIKDAVKLLKFLAGGENLNS